MKLLTIVFSTLLFASCSKNVLNNNSTSDGANGIGGSLARFTLSGNYLYVVEPTSLKTFDVSNPAAPVLQNTIGISGANVETIYPYKNLKSVF